MPHGLPGFADIAVTIAGQTVVKRKALQVAECQLANCDCPCSVVWVLAALRCAVLVLCLKLFKPMIESVRPNILSIFGGHVVDIVGKDLGY